MTETVLAPVPEQVADAPTHEDGAGGGPDRRRLLLLLGGVVALVLVGGAWLLLHGGSSVDTNAAPPVVHRTTGTVPTPSAAPSAPAIPATFDDAVGRDPFKPLVVPPAPSTTPAPSAPPVTPGAPAPGTGAGTAAPAIQPDWIELDSQNGTTSATFQVHSTDGTVQTFKDVKAPASGKTTSFGQYFALISVQDGFAVVQMGDGKPFDLQQGYDNRHMLN